MYPTSHGWELDHQGILLPRTVATGTLSAPADILKLVHWNGKTSGCLTATCICSKVWCTVVCLGEGGEACKNPLTRNQSDEESVEPDTQITTRTLMSKVHKSCSAWLLIDCNINVNKVICLNEWNFYFSCALCS